VLAWLFLAPTLLLVFGIPMCICVCSVIAMFKKPF